MNYLEMITHDLYNAYFVDLFVRASNALAISMYHSLGYIIYRQVLGYYSGEEDAYGALMLIYKIYFSSLMLLFI